MSMFASVTTILTSVSMPISTRTIRRYEGWSDWTALAAIGEMSAQKRRLDIELMGLVC